ncbi:MAG: hypothetical protein K6G26_04285 [Lachnospiraceae bacterium]|nr:hypothetical protein [Lachnospiraceae bacterium]
MKKKVLILVILALVIVAVGGVAGYMIVTRKATTVDAFEKTAKSYDEKFEVSNPGDMNNVKEAVVAKNGQRYSVYFMKMDSEQAAINAFAANKNDYSLFEVDATEHEYKRGLNFHTYTVKTDSKYCAFSQVKDTFVFACVDPRYQDDIDGLFAEMGYLK